MTDPSSPTSAPTSPEFWDTGVAAERCSAAQQAARAFDVDTLWSLTQAYLNNFSNRGQVIPTQRRYRAAIEHFLYFAQARGVDLCAPTLALGEAYFEHLERDEELSLSSIRVHLSANRALYRALRWVKATSLDPFLDVLTFKTPQMGKVVRPSGQLDFVILPPTAPHRYSASQVQMLLDHAPARDQVLVLLHVDAGLRIEQAVKLRWSELDLQRWVFKNTKRSIFEGQWQPLSPRLVLCLKGLPQRKDGLVVGASQTAARQRLRALTEKAGLPYWGWKALKG